MGPMGRRFQFSLRSLLISLTALALCFGISVAPAVRQRDAVRALRKCGGTIDYDFDPERTGDRAKSPCRSSLSRLFGNDFMATVVGVHMKPDEVTWDKKHIGKFCGPLPYTNGKMIVDNDMSAIAALPALERLGLSWTDIGDAGIRQTGRHTSLRELYLDHTNVTDASVAALSSLKQLRRLDLSGTAVSNDAVSRLKKAVPECDIVTDGLWPDGWLEPLR